VTGSPIKKYSLPTRRSTSTFVNMLQASAIIEGVRNISVKWNTQIRSHELLTFRRLFNNLLSRVVRVSISLTTLQSNDRCIKITESGRSHIPWWDVEVS
jgi:hypothetical protein